MKQSSNTSISVVIPTYKNKDLLIKNLEHNQQFVKDCAVIVVNDDPEEKLEKLPRFVNHVINNEKNLGFAGTVNKGIQKTSGEYVLLLNNDVVLVDDTFRKALDHFNDKNIFAVSFAQKEKNGEMVGKNKIYWKNGFFHHSKAENFDSGITAWAEGGSSIFDKNKLLELNLFDDLYAPFYWEDIDLSYRAWKAGYKIFFDREIIVEHHHESTIGKYFDKDKIKSIAYRNQLLFIWKNITDDKLIKDHVTKVFRQSLHNKIYRKGFLNALKLLPHIVTKRNTSFTRRDEEILGLFT